MCSNIFSANAAENTRDQKTAKASVANLYKQPDSSFQYGAPLTLTEEDMQLQLALELSRQEIVRAQNNLSVNDLHLTDDVKHNDIKSWIAQQQILSTKVNTIWKRSLLRYQYYLEVNKSTSCLCFDRIN